MIDHHHGLVESPQPVHDVKIWNAPWLDRYLQNLSCMKNNDKLSSSRVIVPYCIVPYKK